MGSFSNFLAGLGGSSSTSGIPGGNSNVDYLTSLLPPNYGFPGTAGASGQKGQQANQGITGVKWIDTLIALGVPISMLLAGIFSGDISGKKIDPILNPGLFPDVKEPWGQWLQSQVGQGVPGYQGELFPDISQTMLQQVWGGWQPQNQGDQFLANFLTQPKGNQGLLDLFTQTQAQGGPTGQPTNLMNNMTQWGGTGGVGNNLMSLLAQYGATSQAGQYVANMAQFGVPSQGAGGALAKRAAKGAEDWLGPFLARGPSYTAPTPGGK